MFFSYISFFVYKHARELYQPSVKGEVFSPSILCMTQLKNLSERVTRENRVFDIRVILVEEYCASYQHLFDSFYVIKKQQMFNGEVIYDKIKTETFIRAFHISFQHSEHQNPVWLKLNITTSYKKSLSHSLLVPIFITFEYVNLSVRVIKIFQFKTRLEF